jgi:Cu/Ag efflux protein CusF
MQKTILVVVVLPPVAFMIVLKSSWDAENRAKAEREWTEHQERDKKLVGELRRLENDKERYRSVMEAAAHRIETAARARAEADDAKATWFCPMHPQIVRENSSIKKTDPIFTEDKCPICLMPLASVHQIRLSPEEKRLAADQGYLCPIDGTSIFLGTDQAKVIIRGKTVLVCCKKCESKALAAPDKTLAAMEKLKLQFNHTYAVSAKVISIDIKERSVTLAHESIPKLVEAGQSIFSVEQPKLLEGIRPGDNVRSLFLVRSGHYILTQVDKY